MPTQSVLQFGILLGLGMNYKLGCNKNNYPLNWYKSSKMSSFDLAFDPNSHFTASVKETEA